jgi:release factor glutamine methyltransferase
LSAEADGPEQRWTVGSLVAWAADDFRARGIEKPRLDAEVIVGFVLGLSRTQIIIDAQRPLEPTELPRLRGLVKRRRAREPVAYLRGEREFYGRTFRVDKRVLVPRPDTEILVEVALARSRAWSLSARVLDLCTGSGCVAITLARQRPTTQVRATDISADALDVARDNALRLGAYNVSFAQGDLFASARGQYELITANPPYIPSGDIATLQADVRDHEPRLALDGGADGLDFVRRIVDDAPTHLVPGGVLALEIGAGEAADTAKILADRGFAQIEVAKDYGQIERVVSGRFGAP